MAHNLIDLDTADGQKLLSEASQGPFYQPFIHAIFGKQQGPASCGIQSAALVLCAAKMGQTHSMPSKHTEVDTSNVPITERTMHESPATCRVKSEKQIDKEGLTLPELEAVIKSHEIKCKVYFTADSSVEEFREKAKEALKAGNSCSGIIVNYHMGTVGQDSPYGHHSPLGAYHEATDRFLIWDTWKKTKECWAPTADLFKAMQVVDDVSGKCRGFLVVNT